MLRALTIVAFLGLLTSCGDEIPDGCCKCCDNEVSQACGDTCISVKDICYTSTGCACIC